MSKQKTALIPGGAGFIGSHIADAFVKHGWAVTVIDGLLPKTGGRAENLAALKNKITFLTAPIEEAPSLGELVAKADVIVDCMAWTSHLLAKKDPLYDLRLNVESHWHLIQELANHKNKQIIYLGSRGQYGNAAVAEITEETPLVPEDVQGIHKQAAEDAFRFHSKSTGNAVVSLRFSNCFGPRQNNDGPDIGLVGGFIKDLLENKPIEVFGGERVRYIISAGDLAQIIVRLAEKPSAGFQAYNLGGERVQIGDLVQRLIRIIGQGTSTIKPMPEEIRKMDIGNAAFSEEKLKKHIGSIELSDLSAGLSETVNYFRSFKRDLSM